MSTELDPSFEPLIRSFFAELSPVEQMASVSGDLDETVWGQITEMGFTKIDVDETVGGSGGTLPELATVVRILGSHATAAPFVETHIAAWALAQVGVETDETPLTVIVGDDRDSLELKQDSAGNLTLHGTAHDVPWAPAATSAVMLLEAPDGSSVVLAAPLTEAQVASGVDLAGAPRGKEVTFSGIAVTAHAWPLSSGALRSRALLLRSIQMIGALRAVADLTRSYAMERNQFGRPIAAFQSVQKHLVHLEQMATMSAVAGDRAVTAIMRRDDALEADMLKLLVSENAVTAVRAAHQAHGAIGMTQEYRLQALTRRLNTWAGEFASRAALAPRVGTAASSVGISRLITSPSGTHGAQHA